MNYIIVLIFKFILLYRATLAALYVFEVSSRIGALTLLPSQAVDELLSDERVTFTDRVKSGPGAAFTALSPVTYLYLSIYRNVKNLMINQLENLGCVIEDYAFINTRGKKFTKLGNEYSDFFSSYNLRTTTTDARSLLDTASQQAAYDDVISNAERNALCSSNGHSPQTSNQYYVKKDVERQGKKSSEILQKITSKTITNSSWNNDDHNSADGLHEREENISMTSYLKYPVPTITSGQSHLRFQDWGAEWIGQKKGTGFDWTDDEIEVIGGYFENYANPQSKTKAADLLMYISRNAHLRRKFHKHHIEKTSRIRNGIERYQNLLSKYNNDYTNEIYV
jgi:hypothetical protein